ncbi:hypothetical protein WALSEDRAFT_64307 [Wallemia mellicola CBS 633.66]|uniref:Uncharacterized protein n=2 Tax=Wallemia mellicola TaxID=1708541 RepID=A0A4T0NKK4_9BASI|nr:hypothetical protein WALSEDRAFT_64307 [Wallemia mellicola CBS 633.66]TIB74474.1 hypothetical protein E3Q24_00616 [Wallemia mellicola]EIM21687.1 hypothetical protein WALSEDRAFT_64307 [Wallemia mellicola CBS 633.66]TIB90057.1 hypothetical protein E3Q21_00483 [Wallemia mellicola]TIB92485.1 hypothetical protein E3Q20_00200 [Wallemia mellicola]TIB97654.1 hypothetical protein E3Q17_03317 [Wallemia mellicola]|eukprot:XP_006958374.1 hypothetical protein WALSEDRAFT_64307 [Wallemia mellicola CBS 633.66]
MDARALLRAKKAERAPVRSNKRQAESSLDVPQVEKKRKSEVAEIPTDFFDNSASNENDDHEEQQEKNDDNTVRQTETEPANVDNQVTHQKSIEEELMAFDNEISQLDSQPAPSYNPSIFANATISAEPVLNPSATEEATPEGTNTLTGRGQKVISEEQRQVDEEEKLKRIQAYENEDYAQRLEEEARAQEEADARVTALKQRMEEIKARRRK